MTHPDDMLEVDRRCLIETENVMHAWAAYRLARLNDAPIPDWVLRYFDRAGRNLLELSADAHRSGSGKELGPKIAKALGLASGGAGSPLTRYHADWIVFGMNVRDRMTRLDASGRSDLETYAIKSVAEEAGVSEPTVRRAYKLYAKLFPGEGIFPDEALG